MRLAITRDNNQISARLKKQAEQLKVELVSLPFLSTKYLQFSLPDDLSINNVDWLLFTSANGVRSFFAWLNEKNDELAYTTKIAAVGSKTAEAVCSEGLTVNFVPDFAYGKQMFEQLFEKHFKDDDVVLFARGKEVAFDPIQLFENQTVRYYPLVTYETETRLVDGTKIELLQDNDFVLFTSPSTVKAYANQFGKPVARTVAIGNSTAARMKESGWNVHHTLVSANVDTILESLLWN